MLWFFNSFVITYKTDLTSRKIGWLQDKVQKTWQTNKRKVARSTAAVCGLPIVLLDW